MLQLAKENEVGHFLSVCVGLEEYPTLCGFADKYDNISISVGVHPDTEVGPQMTAEHLIELAKQHKACIAIGETGLDYYHVTTPDAQQQQRDLFREHIQAAIATSKPLIIHTRNAAEDTIALMQEEKAASIGGVMHCFTEDYAVAKKAMDMNFYISFSGILTFKNASVLHEVAQKVPLDRILIETDAPYLAPHPFRGKPNHPALVKYTALALSNLRQEPYEKIAEQTTKNFKECFHL
jgi:TatD DNase family protein